MASKAMVVTAVAQAGHSLVESVKDANTFHDDLNRGMKWMGAVLCFVADRGASKRRVQW